MEKPVRIGEPIYFDQEFIDEVIRELKLSGMMTQYGIDELSATEKFVIEVLKVNKLYHRTPVS